MALARAYKIGVAVAAAVIMLVGGGIAYASIPGPDGVISACYKPSDGKLFVIDSSASCPSGTTSLNWNQTGPQGPPGPSATFVTQTVEASGGTVDPGQQIRVLAECPAGWLATGGGFDEGGSVNLNVFGSRPNRNPSDGTGWEVFVVNPTANPLPAPNAYVTCAKLQQP
jgi:hypothetical protein